VSESALDDPPLTAEPGAMLGSASGDDGCDAESSQEPAVLVVVIAGVGENAVGLLAWPTLLAGHRSCVEVFQQRDQLGDVVAVSARQADCERDAARVDEEMVL
jgi:hypothetical protein